MAKLFLKWVSEPNKNWGSRDEDVPVTEITDNLIVPVSIINFDKKSFSGTQEIEIKTINPEDKIQYTIGSQDKLIQYNGPFKIDESTRISAIAFNSESQASKTITSEFFKVVAGRSIKIISKYSPQYTGGGDEALIDLERGEKNWRLGKWQGYKGQDFEAIVDLGKVTVCERSESRIYTGCRFMDMFPN